MNKNENPNDWVRKAFEEAEPYIGGKAASKVAYEIVEAFYKQFLDMIDAFFAVVGPDKAAKATIQIATDDSIRALVRCAFTAGYMQAIKKQEGE